MRWEGHATAHCEVVDPPPLDLAPLARFGARPARSDWNVRATAEGRQQEALAVEGREVAGLLWPAGGAGGGGGWMAGGTGEGSSCSTGGAGDDSGFPMGGAGNDSGSLEGDVVCGSLEGGTWRSAAGASGGQGDVTRSSR